jgi:excisionase family DNA binding protein
VTGDPTQLLNVKEARTALGGVSRATFYSLVNDGDLPVVKVRGRTFVRKTDVSAFIDRKVTWRPNRSASGADGTL